MLNILGIIFITVGVGIWIFFIVKKRSAVLLIQPETDPKAKSQRVKRDIYAQRLERELSERFGWLRRSVQIIRTWFKKSHQLAVTKVKNWERSYSVSGRDEIKLNDTVVENMLSEARGRILKGKLDEAEKELIEVISLRPKNEAAFLLLAEVYEERAQWDNWLETVQFILKLAPGNHAVRARLAEYWINKKQLAKAFKEYELCLKYAPNYPKYLDGGIEMALEIGELTPAKEWVSKLLEVNPQNEKIAEFSKRLVESEK